MRQLTDDEVRDLAYYYADLWAESEEDEARENEYFALATTYMNEYERRVIKSFDDNKKGN